MNTPDSLESLQGAVLRLARVYRQRALDARQQSHSVTVDTPAHAAYIAIAEVYDHLADALEGLLPASVLKVGSPDPG